MIPWSSHNAAHAFEVAGRREQDAGGAGNGFKQHGGHGLGPLGFNRAAQVLQGALGFLLRCLCPELRAVQVGPENVDVAAGVFVGDPAPVAGGSNRGAGVAVIGAVPGNHLVPAGMQPGHPDGVLVGVRAAVGEEDLVHAGRGVGEDRSAARPRVWLACAGATVTRLRPAG